MNRRTLSRRYAPLVVAVAIQLFLIATVPSKAPLASLSAAGESGSGGQAGGGSLAGPGVAGAGGQVGGQPAAGGASASAGGVAASGAAASGGLKPGGGAAAGAGGDTTHCVQGREFDPAIVYFAPPCVAGSVGGAYAGDNGGATYQGVSSHEIKIVDYVSNYGAEVNAILQAEGLLVTYEQAKAFDTAMASFINGHYVLYGRKVSITTYSGQCQSVPPDYGCLIPEMDRVIDTYHPYMFFWDTTLCSACYQEVARRKVVAVGGVGFSDEFANALVDPSNRAQLFYSSGESGTRIAKAFAQFYCGQLSSTNDPNRKVRYAGTQNQLQNFNGQPRRLGILSTNDPDNENTVKKVLVPELNRLCGEQVNHFYFYAQDINTAAQQVAAGIAAMDTPQNPANIVLCLCDPVAPAFVFSGEQNNNYYPENVIASDQGMDVDPVGQSYEQNPDGSASLGCPTPARGCEYDVAFGLSTEGSQRPQEDNEGVRVFKAGGGTSLAIPAIAAAGLARAWVMMANLMEAAGPALNPLNMTAQAPRMGAVGGAHTGDPLLALGPGDWNWGQDARVVYWDKHKVSPYNRKAGSYVQIEGDRYNLGQYPGMGNGPDAIPPQSQRSP